MKNFVYHNPVKVLFGKNTINQLGSEIDQLGGPALLVYGRKKIFDNGVYQQVISSLDNQNITYIEHSGVQPNPLLSHVHKGIEKARKYQCRVVIGIGGGSVIDSAKAIASGVETTHHIWKYFTGKKSVKQVLPIVCVPTLAGSGSEMNSGMVLTHDDKKQKFGFAHRALFPRVCIADPTTTFSCPPDQTAFGAVDTLVHCLEPYFSSEELQAPFQYRFLANVSRTSMETCLQLLTTPNSYDHRATMLWTSSMALSGLSTSGLGKINYPIHLLEHALSALYDIPHGAGLAAVLPGWLAYHRESLAGRFARFGEQVFEIKNGTVEDKSSQMIDRLLHFLYSIDCPLCIKELGINDKHLPEIAAHCCTQARIWRMKDYNLQNVSALLDSCYLPLIK